MKEGLRACQNAGLLSDLDLDLLAHLISGAVNEGVFVIAEATDRDAAFSVVSRTVGTVVRSGAGSRQGVAAHCNGKDTLSYRRDVRRRRKLRIIPSSAGRSASEREINICSNASKQE